MEGRKDRWEADREKRAKKEEIYTIQFKKKKG